MRCFIYARYSSDQQREASIEDQVRTCRSRAEREGWTVIEVFADAAISGASLLRPGYQALLDAMRSGRADIVVAESLDRFSRDLEHVAAFHKQAIFAGVRIITLAEGEVSELHIGLKGTMGALFLKDLADKTRRGLEGRVRQGRGVGRTCYGYSRVRRLGPDGEPERGLRAIDPAEAATVRRIFAEYAAGRSPLAIATSLNAEAVPGPGGGTWFDATIRGRPSRGGEGLLRNPLYIGQLVWNRVRTLKDPATGRIKHRPNTPASVVNQSAPELRIIDDELWHAVQARLAAEAAAVSPTGQAEFWMQRRPRHLLSGKVVCGTCGTTFEARGRDYLRCRRARQHACPNRVSVRRPQLEERVCQALARQLMQPDLVAEFVTEFTKVWNRLAAEAGAGSEALQRDLQTVERQLSNLLDAIAEGLRTPGLQARLDALETRKTVLEAQITAAPPVAPALHPNIAALYRSRVEALHQELSAGNTPEALEAARALIDRVIIHPPEDGGGPPGVELVGEILAMLRAGGVDLLREKDAQSKGALPLFARSVKEGMGVLSLPQPNYRPARTSLPGSAPVCCPFSNSGTPDTKVAL